MSPLERFERELSICGMLATQQAGHYFQANRGAEFLLLQMQGLQSLQQMVLALEGVLITYR